jgi:hypothetical protein
MLIAGHRMPLAWLTAIVGTVTLSFGSCGVRTHMRLVYLL